jgi:hypothetical protein
MLKENMTMEERIKGLKPYEEYIPALKEGDILKTNDANETVTFHIEHISPMIFGDKMCTVYFSKKEDNGGITSVALIAELVDSAIEEGLLEVVKGVN